MTARDTVTGSFLPAEETAWSALLPRFRASLGQFEAAARELRAMEGTVPVALQQRYRAMRVRADRMGTTLRAMRGAVDDVQLAMRGAVDRMSGAWERIAAGVRQVVPDYATHIPMPGALYGVAQDTLDGLPLIPAAVVAAAIATIVGFLTDYAKFREEASLIRAGKPLPTRMSFATQLIVGAVVLGSLWLWFQRRPAS